MNTSRAAIDLRGLGKHFGAVQAVDALTFSVEPGEIFGLMGHNGAGKTTTLRMLLGLTHPTVGSATVLGYDVVRNVLDVRRVSGYLPGAYALPPEMSARQFLQYAAHCCALWLSTSIPTAVLLYRPDFYEGREALANLVVMPSLLWHDATIAWLGPFLFAAALTISLLLVRIAGVVLQHSDVT